MSATQQNQPADQAQRDAALLERERNVLIDAGAGTGKTTLLADRLVEMVAPSSSNAPPTPIGRIAAITFTRKAAGELKVRVRERLLAGLALAPPPTVRAKLLRDALTDLDSAHISTLHSFCDRLLRLRPVDARLSPSYDIAEDADNLVLETFTLLIEAAQTGKLEAELAGTGAHAFAAEAQQTIIDAIAVGLRRDTHEGEFHSYFGLDALIGAFILQRDVPFDLPKTPPFDLQQFQRASAEFLELAKSAETHGAGPEWIARMSRTLLDLKHETEPTAIWQGLGTKLPISPEGKRSGIQRGTHFADAEQAWHLWKQYAERGTKKHPRAQPLRDELLDPLRRWMAPRLIRLFPVAIAFYEKVKTRRRQLDQIDLLLCLRNLLTQNLAARGFYQSLFDHIFVDEFQDTDPLQAEVVLFLCEKAAHAKSWDQVELQPGKLTLVGDPKQSIYRFRRADIAIYEQVRDHVGRAHCLQITLSTNFRSAAPLIDWINERFELVLGKAEAGAPLFDATLGTVCYQPLQAGPRADRTKIARVRVLPLHGGGDAKADDFRATEAEALARYLRHMVDAKSTRITDPIDGALRPVRFGDIAVLAISTWNLGLLFPHLDRFGIPCSVRGGQLLLRDPLHRQFVLALRAISDRDDGPAQAALLRAPFFAIDLIDLLHERGQAALERGEPLPGVIDAERAARARQAVALIRDLRQRRHSRSVGSTARDLLERTAFGRALATGPNGEQRLERVREILRALDALATAECLDFDGATERARAWIDAPIALDPPHPAGAEAVRVLTIHQAKGLEFPVVVLWDGMAAWAGPQQTGAFRLAREGKAWSICLDGLEYEEPRGAEISKREKVFRDAERKRTLYVAATRARDLLILAAPTGAKPGRQVSADRGAEEVDSTGGLIERLAPFGPELAPPWSIAEEQPAMPIAPPKGALKKASESREASLDKAWRTAATASAKPHLVPTSVTNLAHAKEQIAFLRSRAEVEDGAADQPTPRPRRESRFGNVFGDGVHRAIGFALRDPRLSIAEAVNRAARAAGLREHLAEAAADVERTLASLRREGFSPANSRLEFPVWSAITSEHLVQGFIDLLVEKDGALIVIDFKTDAAPAVEIEVAHPAYVAQVRAYRGLLEGANVRGNRDTRCALLFTADGGIRWC